MSRFHFCFPLDLQLLASAEAAEGEWPTLVFEAFERDSWNRLFMQGFGFLQLPRSCGVLELDVPTWKPSLDARDQLREFFIGGMVRPRAPERIARTSVDSGWDTRSPLSRASLGGESAGRIRVRLNVAVQSKQVKAEERFALKEAKRSEQTEQRKDELGRQHLPPQVSTALVQGGRYTHFSRAGDSAQRPLPTND